MRKILHWVGHRRMTGRIFLALSVLFLSSLLTNSKNTFAGTKSIAGVEFLSFQVGAYLGVPVYWGSNLFSGYLSWNPQYSLNESFVLRGQFGGSILPDGFTTIVMLTYQILLEYRYEFLSIDAGGGFESWLNYLGSTAPAVTGAVAYRPSEKFFGVVERIFVQYSFFTLPLANTNQIMAGVGFVF